MPWQGRLVKPEALPYIGTSLANFRDEEGVFDDLH